ncbi:MAG: response regulator transcription factor [Candidatus Dormibacteraeota bacterium]|uniref:Response regulator transcription factor n=1 Tax=Candidatus Aeolococcus gillhamiae TaxID=3127015 RepID=A0A934JXJ5_9BACT|nr:response regulator transcription factor [Candidatus Dormibacteraeota bacterium]
MRVLVVDDDAMIRKAVRLTCESEGYEVTEVERGADALAAVEAMRPDMVLLDLMMPDMSGFDICREIRRAGHRVPVVILSAKSDEIDVVLGFEIGADDYIQKPFRPRELLARIAAHLRKVHEPSARNGEGRRLTFRGLVIDTGERRVVRDGDDITLTHTEFDLLAFLAGNAGEVLSRDRILSSVWGYEHPIETRVIDVHVRNLRRKIEPDPSQPRYILAVPGIGYRFTNTRPEGAR